MRISLISREYPSCTPSGGIGTYVSCIAPALAARGHDVHVLCCWAKQEARDWMDRNVLVHQRTTRRLPGIGRLFRAPGAAGRVAQAASVAWHSWRSCQDADIIEAPDYMAEGLFSTRHGRRSRRVPVVVHLHTPSVLLRRFNAGARNWDSALAERLERKAVELAHGVTAPSQLVIDLLREDHGWRGLDDARVIPYPIDLELWSRVEPVGTNPRVLFVGRVEPLKGADTLLEAMALLAREVEGVEAVFIGSTGNNPQGEPFIKRLASQAQNAGASCTFVPYVERPRLVEFLETARVVAIPSVYDNFPMVALEAMASGRPVVCSQTVGTAPIINRLEPRSVFPPRDAIALACALRPYLEGEQFAMRMGAAARKMAAQICNPEAIAESRESFYLELLNNR